MTKRQVVKWVFLLLGLGLGVAALTLYLLADNVPSDYKPVTVPSDQKHGNIANLEDKVLREFIGPAGEISSRPDGQAIDPNKSFVMHLGQDELNEWVGSLPDEAMEWLGKYGFKDPAIAINHNRVTLYIYWAEYKKVMGIDFQPMIRDDGMLTIELRSVRMGNLAMPQSFIDTKLKEQITKMQASLTRDAKASKDDPSASPAKNLRKAAASILMAASGSPVNPRIRESWGNVRLSRIRIEKEHATIEVVPIVPGEGGLINKMTQLKAKDAQ